MREPLALPTDLARVQAARRVLAVLDDTLAVAAAALEAGEMSPAEVLDLLRCRADVALIARLPAGWTDLWEAAQRRHLETMNRPDDGLEVTCA